jgi:hypothetical protein
MSTHSAALPRFESLYLAAVRRNMPLLIVYGLILGAMFLGTTRSDRFLTDRNLLT